MALRFSPGAPSKQTDEPKERLHKLAVTVLMQQWGKFQGTPLAHEQSRTLRSIPYLLGNQEGVRGMSDGKAFSVFECRSVAGRAYAIVAHGSEKDRHGERFAFTEAFLVIRGAEKEYRPRRIRCWVDEQSSASLENMLVELVKKWVAGELEQHLYAWRQKEAAGGMYPDPFEISELQELSAARLWLLDAFSKEHLETIRKDTRCDEVRNFASGLLELAKLKLETE